MTKPNKEQFEEYVAIQRSGITNMFDGRYVCELSSTGLTKDICLYIMTHYKALSEEFEVDT